LTLEQQAADEVGCDDFRGADEEGVGERRKVLDGRGGYGAGYWVGRGRVI